MLVLVVDTALSACQVALVRDGAAVALRTEAMERGHQERLAPLADEHDFAVRRGDTDGVAVGDGVEIAEL